MKKKISSARLFDRPRPRSSNAANVARPSSSNSGIFAKKKANILDEEEATVREVVVVFLFLDKKYR